MDSAQWLVLALLLHVLWTFAIGAMSLRRRIAALQSGQVRLTDIAVDGWRWPEETRKFSNNFDNQFQVPMFAYGAGAMLLATDLADGTSAALMWLFLLARLMHSIEQVGRNDLRRRFAWFLVSFLAVMAVWVWFAARFLAKG